MHALDPVLFTFLNGSNIEQFEQADSKALDAVERAVPARGHGETLLGPRVHLMPCATFDNHTDILRDRLRVAPLGPVAGEAS